MWEDFLRRIPHDVNLVTPLWTLEFGANYPFEETTPFSIGSKGLTKYKGSRGINLSKVNQNKIMDHIPPYAQYSSKKNEDLSKKNHFPVWKKSFIRKARNFYKENNSWIDPWIKKYQNHSNPIFNLPTHLKLEWNCKGEKYTLKDKVISFRQSGMRVKRLDAAPTLVNFSTTSTPYIPSIKRYLCIEECLKIQGLHELINENLPETNEFYRAVGNAVNADVVEKIAEVFLDEKKTKKHRKKHDQLSLRFSNTYNERSL